METAYFAFHLISISDELRLCYRLYEVFQTAFNSQNLKAGQIIIQLNGMSQNRRKGSRCKFKPEEDEKLRKLVKEMNDKSWDVISAEMEGRNSRQCRERWKHYLSAVNPGQPWTPEDDQLLRKKVLESGPKWTRISQALGDRTDIETKARWLAIFDPRTRKLPCLVRSTERKSPDGKTAQPSEYDVNAPDPDIFTFPVSWEIGSSEQNDGGLFGDCPF